MKGRKKNMDSVLIENLVQTQVNIHRIYTKNHQFDVNDIADEPIFFSEEWAPQIHLQVNPRSKLLKSGRYEVMLRIQLTLTQSSKQLVQINLEQAGLFTLLQVPFQKQEIVLYGLCANLLFPYVGAMVNLLLAQAGFPPIYLVPLDFIILYQRYIAQQQTQNKTKQEEKFIVSSLYESNTLH